jgi:hypothetical protein
MTDLFKSTSRFKLTELIEYRGTLAPGIMKKFAFLDKENLPDDQIVRVEILGDRAGRPDLISLDLYGTTLFKWVLLLFNNVTNPFGGWPLAGTAIEAPTNDAVWKEL